MEPPPLSLYIEMEERKVKAVKVAFNHTQITQFLATFAADAGIEGIECSENKDITYSTYVDLSFNIPFN